jgi:hypothetical protein
MLHRNVREASEGRGSERHNCNVRTDVMSRRPRKTVALQLNPAHERFVPWRALPSSLITFYLCRAPAFLEADLRINRFQHAAQ